MTTQAASIFHTQTPVLGNSQEPDLSSAESDSSAKLITGIYLKRGFTLIELMISIALVLLLILGVNQIFTYTTQAVGAGEAINSAIRSSRAAQGQFASDFNGIVPNGGNPNDAAGIIIASRAYYAFRDAKDQAAQGNSSQTTYPPAAYLDLAGSGNFGDSTVNGDIVYPTTYNFRNHRLDVLSFFARGLFPRQTGNPGTFVDNMASQEAWIWYGHLHLPDNSGNFPNTTAATPSQATQSTFPCMGTSATNPNNYFGSKLVLGRMAVLLSAPNISGNILDNSGTAQWFIGSYTGGLTSMDPLWAGAKAQQTSPPLSDSSAQAKYCLPSSRLDIAGTSIAQFRKSAMSPPPSGWYDDMMDGEEFISLSGANGHPNYARFQCNPYIGKPMTAQGMSQASPYFLGGCSQFIVEFAGDFLTQDNDPSHIDRGSASNLHTTYGDITAYASDGQLDFTIVNGVKQIKWYGMPRATSGSLKICAINGDVVPVRDWLQLARSTDGSMAVPLPCAPFEQYQTTGGGSLQYLTYQATDYGNGNMTAAQANTGYICAFGPTDPAPKLIRITMTLDDPTGRLPDGLTYQYVFPVPTP